jgi:hypothetical protein
MGVSYIKDYQRKPARDDNWVPPEIIISDEYVEDLTILTCPDCETPLWVVFADNEVGGLCPTCNEFEADDA